MAMCDCGRIAIIRTSWTSLNLGRRFHSCPRPVGQCRRFLGWVDPSMCPRAIDVIPGLLRAKNNTDEEVERLKSKIKAKDTTIFVLVLVIGYLVLF
ncbi:hypothetical protein R6Q59_029968 [Mikania micrantha]